MGNVHICCCKSGSPRKARSHGRRKVSCSSRGRPRQDDIHDNQPSPYILQHISEREPDDSETDPSSNPVDRPIFAARSCKSRSANTNSIYSNNHSDSFVCGSQRIDTNPLNDGQQNHSCCGSNPTTPDDCRSTLVQSFRLNKTDDIEIQDKDSLIARIENAENIIDFGAKTEENLSHLVTGNELRDESNSLDNSQSLLRVNSCSRIHCDGSTISQPKLKQTIKGVSLAIYFHLKNRTSDDYVEIFDETIYPLKLPKNVELNDDGTDDKIDMKYFISDSEGDEDQHKENENNENLEESTECNKKTIYQFVKTLFKAAQLSSEYAITALVYLERLMTYAEMDLTPKTWRRMFLGAILLSSKVWEDQAVWNVDYAQILEEISVEDINELERQFLGLIQFNMNVPSSVYAKYYFHLRTLALTNDISKRYSLMTVKEAIDLEALSFDQNKFLNRNPTHKRSNTLLERHKSLNSISERGRSRAVIM